MKRYLSISIFIFIPFILNASLFCKIRNNSEILYLSPLPGSKYASKETNIIIRYKKNLNFSSVSEKYFKITGTESGEHKCVIIRTDESNSVILKPDVYFYPGETVNVKILKGLKTSDAQPVSSYNFHFTISNSDMNSNYKDWIPSEELGNLSNNYNNHEKTVSPVFLSDSLPPDFPQITVLVNNSTSPGNIFLSNFGFGQGFKSYLMVLDNNGYPLKYKKINNAYSLDFKVQNGNTFTFQMSTTNHFYCTNSFFTIIDSFSCGNGYITDGHDFLLLPDYHAYLISYDPQIIDMSKIVPGGNPRARVIGFVIQELDKYKTVIFQWRSWDHFQITDATHENFQDTLIDYVHGNSIDLDFDGNLLISSRHLDEITKIDRKTGDIIWRLGGKNNQFAFINDTLGFSHQHAFRRVLNKSNHYTLFDNGNFHSPRFSRAIEYEIDQVNKTCRLVWQFRHNDSVYAMAMGYTHRLPSGNTIIGWGSTTPTITEVDPNGNKVFELTFPQGVFSYRAYRLTWMDGAQKPYPESFSLLQNFPNPFNPYTTIRYDLSEDGYVTLKIYDMLGKEIKTLVSENLTKGNYSVSFNARDLSSGVYFYKLDVNGYTESKKMLLIK